MDNTKSIDLLEPSDARHRVGGWSAARIRIGRVVFENIVVNDREGAVGFFDAMRLTIEQTRRIRGVVQTRYAHLPASGPSRLLSMEVKDYLADLERIGVRPSTILARSHAFRLLKLACGDILVTEITPDHIRTLWDVIRWWPGSEAKTKAFRGMTDEAILAWGKQANVPAKASSSLETVRRNLVSFFNRLLKIRVISHSPMDAFGKARKDLIPSESARPFTEDEFKAIFDPKTFLPWASRFPHCWWVPMIGLYSGARIAEISQMKVADIVQEGGHWYFAIRKTVDEGRDDCRVRSLQRLKGASSIRTIPIAQPLIDAGLLDYLEDVKACGHARLFPHLPAGTDRKTGEPNGAGYGTSMCAQFSRHLKKKLGIQKGVRSHAFRHYLCNQLEGEGISKEVIASITGHTGGRWVPVLERHYLGHVNPTRLRQLQRDAIALLAPPVVLPRYVKGQFARKFRKGAKMYP